MAAWSCIPWLARFDSGAAPPWSGRNQDLDLREQIQIRVKPLKLRGSCSGLALD